MARLEEFKQQSNKKLDELILIQIKEVFTLIPLDL